MHHLCGCMHFSRVMNMYVCLYICVCVHIYVNICTYIETFIKHISLAMYHTHQMI